MHLQAFFSRINMFAFIAGKAFGRYGDGEFKI